ncbi:MULTISPECIES: hypothetical protein [unclassified Streptomyces]|uniref:hypothetical protein n=1 Tax=unclassified Streptomyces TaxID=2593676 RepID=UPI0006AE1BFD|nr:MULTISPECIES: hypothetical protein [unclassified Streptomyces]KOX33033.1 hypothetical protein ADL06_09815 [Streptomyces sp. NRRL F-6491]KOX49533.1 hypothetical protein ADL08_08510 [Streptomyces sp. NRRL F-6492]
MPSYRYLTQNALTGAFLATDLPLSQVEFGPALSGTGALTAVVEPRLAHLDRSQFDPGASLIYAERDGRLLWGGIVWRSIPEGQQMRIEAAGVGSYPHRRHDLHGNLGGRGPYVYADPCKVIRDVWAYCQGQPDGNLRVAVDATTSKVTVGTPAEPYHVDWWDAPTLGGVIEDMTAVEGGPEWTEDVSWTGDGKPALRMRLGWPRLGRRRTDISFTTGVNIVRAVPVEYDADQAAQVVVALGAGEGRSRRRATDAARDNRLRLEHLLEVPNEQGNDRLAARARTERVSRQITGEVTEVVVRDHPAAPIGSWQIGDDVPVRVYDEWTTFDAWCRIVGWQLRPGAGEEPEQAVLQLQRADRFTYMGGSS